MMAEFQFQHLDCVHTMPSQFENDEKCDGSKIGGSFHTMPEQFENGRKFGGEKLVVRLRCQKNVPAP